MDRPIRHERHHNARKTFHDKNPRPSGQAADTAHLRDGPRQESPESARQRRRGEYDGHAKTALVPTIPLGDIKVNSREETALEGAEESSGCHEALVILDEALADYARGPGEHYEGKPCGRAYTL